MEKPPSEQKFTGATRYVLDDELASIVNVSMALEMPLLMKGEPGTGKTMLAHAIAENFTAQSGSSKRRGGQLCWTQHRFKFKHFLHRRSKLGILNP